MKLAMRDVHVLGAVGALVVASATLGAASCASVIGADFGRNSDGGNDGSARVDGAGDDASSSGDDDATVPTDDAGDATVGGNDATTGDDDASTDGSSSGDDDGGSTDASDAGDGGGGGMDGSQPVLDGGLAACGDMSGLQVGSPWPMEGRCPGRANRTAAPSLKKGALKWRYDFAPTSSSEVVTAPVIGADGTVYLMVLGTVGDASNVWALYALSSAGKLKFATSLGNTSSTPVLGADGRVYVHGAGKLIAVDGMSGSIVWTLGLSTTAQDSPQILPDGRVVVLDGANMVFVTPTGASPTTQNFTLPSNPAQRFVYDLAVSPAGTLYALAATTGSAKYTLYGIDSALQTTLTPFTIQGYSDSYVQMDDTGDVVITSDAVNERYTSSGSIADVTTYTGALDYRRGPGGYTGTRFWLPSDMNGPAYYDIAAKSFTVTKKLECPMVSIAVVGDGTLLFERIQCNGTPANALESWTEDGTMRWTVPFDSGNDDPKGVAVAADGTVYAPYQHTLYAIGEAP